MNAALDGFTISPAAKAMRDTFLRWQCSVRKSVMREHAGRPDDAITPDLTLPGQHEPMGQILTVLCKAQDYSVTPELMHVFRKTNDPAERREQALRYFAATYYQKPKEFSDTLTATFPPGSAAAARIRAAQRCTLSFRAYSVRFDLDCRVWRLGPQNPLFEATWWHNLLFNPNLHPETEVLGFEPNWSNSTSEPM